MCQVHAQLGFNEEEKDTYAPRMTQFLQVPFSED